MEYLNELHKNRDHFLITTTITATPTTTSTTTATSFYLKGLPMSENRTGFVEK
jgi:hypothetical protein